MPRTTQQHNQQCKGICHKRIEQTLSYFRLILFRFYSIPSLPVYPYQVTTSTPLLLQKSGLHIRVCSSFQWQSNQLNVNLPLQSLGLWPTKRAESYSQQPVVLQCRSVVLGQPAKTCFLSTQENAIGKDTLTCKHPAAIQGFHSILHSTQEVLDNFHIRACPALKVLRNLNHLPVGQGVFE